MRVTAARSRRRAATRSAAVSPPLDTASRSPPNPCTKPPEAPQSAGEAIPWTGYRPERRGGRASAGRPQKPTFASQRHVRLKNPLKPPQNATDVITIVMFQTPVTARPGRLAAPVEEALDGPHPRRDPALVRAGGLPGEGRRLL